jgi:hypothetical protein
MSGWTQEDLDRRNRELFGLARPAVVGGNSVALDKPSAEIPEWMIEAECTKLLEEDGWRALRTDPVSDRSRGKGFGELGMADHLYLRYDAIYLRAHVLWVEFKSASGKPKKHQLDWHAKERARGALTWIAGVDFPATVEGFWRHYIKSGMHGGNSRRKRNWR